MGVIQRQGIKNTVFVYLGVLLGAINLLFIQPHFLTKEEVGLVGVLFGVSALISTFLPMGVSNITIRYFPNFHNPGKRHYGFFGFMLIFPLLGFLLLSGLLLILKPQVVAFYIEQSALFTK